MPASKSGGVPKKKHKTLHKRLSGKEASKVTEAEDTTADKAAQEFENTSEGEALKTQEEADLQMARDLGASSPKIKDFKSSPFSAKSTTSFATSTATSGFSFGGASRTG